MKLSLFYYSGAGNTKFIAKKLSKHLRQDFSVSSHRITVDLLRKPRNTDAEVIGIGFPIYFRKAPELVMEFLGKLEGQNRKIFFFCTKGLYSGNAIREVMQLAVERGFAPIDAIEFFMPGTDALLLSKKGSLLEKFFKSIHSRHIDQKIARFTHHLLERKMPLPRRKWYIML